MNQYRPHLIRVRGLAVVLVLVIVAQCVSAVTTNGQVSVLGQTAKMKVSDLLALTNKQREANRLPDLQLSDSLSQAAFLKTQDMFEAQYWAHTSPSGVQPWKWFGDVGYNYSYAGENLAKNYPTAQATIEAWMNSETHRANVLSAHYTEVGFAVAEGVLDNEETTLVVALYGAPVTLAAVQAGTQGEGSFMASSVSTSATNPLAYFAAAFNSLNPASIFTLILLGVVALVGAAAHHYRQKLPKQWRRSWRMHHGMYTFFGMILLGVLVVLASGGGSI